MCKISGQQMSIKGVFFDLYGTLLIFGDMSAAWSDWLSEFYVCLKKRGLSISKETFSESCDRFFGKDEPPEREDSLTVFERRIQALCADLKVSAEAGEIKHIATTIVNAWQKHISLDSDCHTVLEALRPSKTLGLISNFDYPSHIFALVRELGLEEFFDTVIVSGNVGIKKPDPRIFHLALEETGLQPEEAVYVGDTEEDVVGARAAGILPILLQRDLADNHGVASDFRADQETVNPPPKANTLTGVVTINSLPELIKVLE